MLRWHKVRDLARKEIQDILRDRRTVFMAIVFPLILYPLLIIGLIQATVVEETKARKEKPVVALSGGGFAPMLEERLTRSEGFKTVLFDGSLLSLREVKASVGVVIGSDFRDVLAANGTAMVKIMYDSADDRSLDARAKVSGLVEAFGRDVLGGRLKAASLDAAFVRPVEIDESDIATPRQRGVFRLGKMLAFILVMFCMMGALYPALDAVAGEKERGTLETLFSIPAARLEILAGKYVAVFSMSIASVLSNFLSLSVTMLLVNKMLTASTHGELPIDFSIPFSALFLLVPALVPLAAFFSAVSLGIASFARSTREGQYYLAPLYAASLPLTMAAIVPGFTLTYVTALVPIMSISLFLKDGLLGTLDAGPTFVALAAQSAYAWLALKWAAKVFSREEVLFSSPVGEGAVLPGAKGYATPTNVIFIWAVSVILFFFAGNLIAARLGFVSIATAIANSALILGPAVIFVMLERLDARKLFPFARVKARAGVSLVFFIPAALLVNIAAGAVQTYLLPAPTSVVATLGAQQASFAAFFITLALLPAVVEELFYRGFVMQSLGARLSPLWAIALSSALFAAAHLNPYEFVPLFALGVVLALSMRATGTLLVPIAIHFANNLITVVAVLGEAQGRTGWFSRLLHAEGGSWLVPVAGVLGAALLLAAIRVARSGRAAA